MRFVLTATLAAVVFAASLASLGCAKPQVTTVPDTFRAGHDYDRDTVIKLIAEVKSLNEDDLPSLAESLVFVQRLVDNPEDHYDERMLVKCTRVLEDATCVKTRGLSFDNGNWYVILKDFRSIVEEWKEKIASDDRELCEEEFSKLPISGRFYFEIPYDGPYIQDPVDGGRRPYCPAVDFLETLPGYQSISPKDRERLLRQLYLQVGLDSPSKGCVEELAYRSNRQRSGVCTGIDPRLYEERSFTAAVDYLTCFDPEFRPDHDRISLAVEIVHGEAGDIRGLDRVHGAWAITDPWEFDQQIAAWRKMIAYRRSLWLVAPRCEDGCVAPYSEEHQLCHCENPNCPDG